MILSPAVSFLVPSRSCCVEKGTEPVDPRVSPPSVTQEYRQTTKLTSVPKTQGIESSKSGVTAHLLFRVECYQGGVVCGYGTSPFHVQRPSVSSDIVPVRFTGPEDRQSDPRLSFLCPWRVRGRTLVCWRSDRTVIKDFQ